MLHLGLQKQLQQNIFCTPLHCVKIHNYCLGDVYIYISLGYIFSPSISFLTFERSVSSILTRLLISASISIFVALFSILALFCLYNIFSHFTGPDEVQAEID